MKRYGIELVQGSSIENSNIEYGDVFPEAGTETPGQLFFKSDEDKIYVRNGANTEWITSQDSDGAGSVSVITDNIDTDGTFTHSDGSDSPTEVTVSLNADDLPFEDVDSPMLSADNVRDAVAEVRDMVGSLSDSTDDSINALSDSTDASISALNDRVDDILPSGIGENSISIGYNSQSAGDDSVAIGSYTQADAQDAIAIGDRSKATLSKSIGIGARAEGRAVGAIAIGSEVSSQYADTIAIGNDVALGFADSMQITTRGIGGVLPSGGEIIISTNQGALKVDSTGALFTSDDGGTNWAVNAAALAIESANVTNIAEIDPTSIDNGKVILLKIIEYLAGRAKVARERIEALESRVTHLEGS